MIVDARRKPLRFSDIVGRRYFLEIALIFAAKIVALTLIYFALVAPQPRADTSPDAIRARMTESSATANAP